MLIEYIVERESVTKLQANKLKALAKRQQSFLEAQIVEKAKGFFDIKFAFSEIVEPPMIFSANNNEENMIIESGLNYLFCSQI